MGEGNVPHLHVAVKAAGLCGRPDNQGSALDTRLRGCSTGARSGPSPAAANGVSPEPGLPGRRLP